MEIQINKYNVAKCSTNKTLQSLNKKEQNDQVSSKNMHLLQRKKSSMENANYEKTKWKQNIHMLGMRTGILQKTYRLTNNGTYKQTKTINIRETLKKCLPG